MEPNEGESRTSREREWGWRVSAKQSGSREWGCNKIWMSPRQVKDSMTPSSGH